MENRQINPANLRVLVTIKFFILLLFSDSFSQQYQNGGMGMWPSYVKYFDVKPEFSLKIIPLYDVETREVVLSSDLIFIGSEEDELGFKHYRFQQLHAGIPVEHAVMNLHAMNNKIECMNGSWIKIFPEGLSVSATISESKALSLALEQIGAQIYKWQLPEEEQFLKSEQNNLQASFFPKAELVFYSGEIKIVPSQLRLAYKFEVYAHQPLSKQFVFVDANSGEILGFRELLHLTNANGTAITAYSGSQSVRTDYNGSYYRLRETNRGGSNGVINTYNLQRSTNYSAAVDFADADNNWNNVNSNKDEYATDAHWGTEKTYDYFMQKHNRNSIDNLGFPLNTYVHYSLNYFNAFWDGQRMTYGDGDATNSYKPLTSLDVCGHEISHGVTQRTSNLVYSYESGALNEAFSDIFGTAIEFYARPSNADWLMGADFYTIRSMSNPNAYNSPDTYLGTHWYNGSGDNGGVHINSGVLNYWFYLLSIGGSGINDHGVSFSVTGIGIDEAARVAYRLNTIYLNSTSDYNDARFYGVLAAEDLFGTGSSQSLQVKNAFIAVGLYPANCTNVANLRINFSNQNSAILAWDAVAGANYYQMWYKPSSSGIWNSLGSVTGTNYLLSTLSPSTTYDFRVKGSCSPAPSSIQFSTANPVCNMPSNLEKIVSDTVVQLFWDYIPYASRYRIQYKTDISAIWTDAGYTANNTITLTGLLPYTNYDFRVSADCQFDSSAYAQSQFTTNSPALVTPAGLSVSYLGNVTTCSWNAVPGATYYRLQLSWPGAVFEPEFDTIIYSNSVNILNLGSGFNLNWRVRAGSSTNLSLFANSSLSTPCYVPANLQVSNVTSSGAQLRWSPGSANSMFGFRVYYRLSSSNTWTTAGTTTDTSFVLSNLSAGANYFCKVIRLCYFFNSSEIQNQFTTPCNTAPNNLLASNITSKSALANWNAIQGVTSYILRYKLISASTWTTVSGIVSNSYQLTNLTAGQTYNWSVAAACVNGTSPFSNSNNFVTYCASSGKNTSEWIDYFSLGSISSNSGANATGYAFYNLSTNLVLGSNTNQGIISAGFPGNARSETFAVYIDLNRNGSFSDVGERVYGIGTFNTAGNVSFNIAVPATATPGQTTLRVVLLRSGSMGPCNIGKNGEIEDYFVNLVNPSPSFVNQTTSVEPVKPNLQLPEISPNPSNGLYRITFPENYSPIKVEVYNSAGALILEDHQAEWLEYTINISEQPAGIYFVLVKAADGNITNLKVIKSNY